MKLIKVDKSSEHYRICKLWLENKKITKWLTSILRSGRYYKLTHDLLVGNPKSKVFFITKEGKEIGVIGLFNIDKIDKRAEIFFFIGSSSEKRKGLASEAIACIQEESFRKFGLRTFYANAVEANIASIKILEKTGFKYVGKYRNAFNSEGNYRDLMTFDWISKKVNE